MSMSNLSPGPAAEEADSAVSIPNSNSTDVEGNQSVPNGVVSPQSLLDSLPSHPSDSKSPQCLNCVSEDKPAVAPVKELPCGHYFHGGCLLKWLMKGNTCPICRFDLGVDPDCPDLTQARWARTGPNEWMSVGDGLDRWILRRLIGSPPDDTEDWQSDDDFIWSDDDIIGSDDDFNDPDYSPPYTPPVEGTSPGYW